MGDRHDETASEERRLFRCLPSDPLAQSLVRDHTFAVAAIRNGTSGRGVK
jgi:hypothetical protein